MNKGIVYMILASLAFSVQNVIVKELSYGMGTGEIAFIRGCLSAVFIVGLMRAHHIHFSHCDRPALLFRGIMGGGGMICTFYALRGMPLADISILSQLSAFFVMIFAVVFFKESVPKRAVMPLIGIVSGACLVIRPWNFSSFNSYSFFVLAQALFAAIAYTTISRLTGSGRHHQYEIVFYFLVCAALSGAVLMGIGEPIQMPGLLEWGLFAVLAVTTLAAQIFMTDAYLYGNAVVVSFVAYIAVVFNALWGFVFFDEIVTVMTVAGGVFIIGCSMYLTKLKHDAIGKKCVVFVRNAR